MQSSEDVWIFHILPAIVYLLVHSVNLLIWHLYCLHLIYLLERFYIWLMVYPWGLALYQLQKSHTKNINKIYSSLMCKNLELVCIVYSWLLPICLLDVYQLITLFPSKPKSDLLYFVHIWNVEEMFTKTIDKAMCPMIWSSFPNNLTCSSSVRSQNGIHNM